MSASSHDAHRRGPVSVAFWMAADRVATIMVIATTGALLWMATTGRIEIPGVIRATTLPPVEDVEELQLTTHVPPEAWQGHPSAKVVLIEFGDYECPFCGQHARQVYPEILRRYVESGQVQYAFRHFPIERHPLSLTAAEAAECARAQGAYWDVHVGLFDVRGGLSEAAASRIAQESGMELAAFHACREGEEAVRAVRHDQVEARALGVRGTPTFFVGLAGDEGTVRLLKRFSGARPYAFFADVLDAVLSTQSNEGRS